MKNRRVWIPIVVLLGLIVLLVIYLDITDYFVDPPNVHAYAFPPTLFAVSPTVKPRQFHDPISNSTLFCEEVCADLFTDSLCTPSNVALFSIDRNGLGHNFNLLVYFLRIAKDAKHCVQYTPFNYTESSWWSLNPIHSSYSWVDELFGLDNYFTARRNAYSHFPAPANLERFCPPDSPYKTTFFSECFARWKSEVPSFALVLEEARPCFQCIASNYGALRKTPILHQEISVVWHLRLGDYKTSTQTYMNTLAALDEVLKIWNGTINHTVVYYSKDEAEVTESTKALRKIFFNHSLFFFPSRSEKDAILKMMNSDILVNCGSSFPMVSPMFSNRMIFLNHIPKHGFHFGQEYFHRDGVWMNNDGTIGLADFPFKLLMKAKLSQPRFHYS
jgi:hypothetical protein